MKQFLIKYRHTNGTTEDWHREIGRFIAAIQAEEAENRRAVGKRLQVGRNESEAARIPADGLAEQGRMHPVW